MKERKFKVGDRVKLGKNLDWLDGYAVAGQIGTVTTVHDTVDDYYGIMLDEDDPGSELLCLEHEIELYQDETPDAKTETEITFPAPVRVEKFLFIEDGSVDADELMDYLCYSNPEIKVVIYRQGSQMPKLVEVK